MTAERCFIVTCFYPLSGYRSKSGRNSNGRWPVVFNPSDGYVDMPVTVPCGQCIGCRLERSRTWAVRCVHEASLYDNNCFITLTFNDDNLDSRGSLVKADFQKFMKRLRKRFGNGIRFFHCGEYGEINKRPHHHACLFNFDFPDKKIYRERKGIRLYTSAILNELWPYGYSTVGDVTYESAAYVARYILKKVTGDGADEHYGGRVPEYNTMSRRPGIARDWIEKYYKDVYPHDYVVIRDGIKCKAPRYYDDVYDDLTSNMDKIKRQRKIRIARMGDDSYERLRVKEECVRLRLKKLKRGLEDGNLCRV